MKIEEGWKSHVRFNRRYNQGTMPATGYGGTKRRRDSVGVWGRPGKRSKEFHRTGRKLRRMYRKANRRRGKRNAPMYRPVRMGRQQPVRMFAKHIVVINQTCQINAGDFSQRVATFFPTQGNNVLRGVTGQRMYPANWEAYAAIYGTVRIHGIKIDAYLMNTSANANGGFISTFYSQPGPNGAAEASDPYVVANAITQQAFLQEKGIRKNRVLGTGTQKSSRNNVHKSGYWSVKRIQSENDLAAHETELEVNADGSSLSDPELKMAIFHKLVPEMVTGSASTENLIGVRYVITLYADWSARRRVFAGNFTVI